MVLVKIQARVPKNRKIVIDIPKDIPVDAAIELQVSFQDEKTDHERDIDDNDRPIHDLAEDNSLLDENHVIMMPSLHNRVIKGRITGKSVAEPEPIVSFENIDIDD
jgi:hypothetical protein